MCYDSGGYTVQEILLSFCDKLLEIIDLVNKNEEICDGAHTIIENIRNEVVPDLVDDIIKELQDKGYFDNLVNVTLMDAKANKTDGGLDRLDATSEFVTSMQSYIGLVNKAYQDDNGTRFYILPKDHVTDGVGGCVKIFADPYHNGGDYRDLGIYFSANQNGDTGYNNTGVNWFNVKVLDGGQYDGKHPDIGFSFQDGKYVGGRFTCFSNGSTVFVVGEQKPDTHRSGVFSKMEVQGNMAITNNNQIRFASADNLKASTISLTPSNILKESLIGSKETYINGNLIMTVTENKVQTTRSIYTNENVVFTDNLKGVVLKSPNGSQFKIKVNDNGILTTERI